MKKSILFVSLLIFAVFELIGQCGSKANIPFLGQLGTEINGNLEQKIVNTYWHVIRDGNGNSNNDISFYEQVIDQVKFVYGEQSIYLESCNLNNGSRIYFHDDEELYGTESEATANFCAFKDYILSDGINIFLIEGAENTFGKAKIGGNFCFVKFSNHVEAASTTVHELGHCFGLFHTNAARPVTFGNLANWQCNNQGASGWNGFHSTFVDCEGQSSQLTFQLELVDGSNGHETGDFVVDTPADIRIDPSDCATNPYDDCETFSCSQFLNDNKRKDPECNILEPDWYNFMRAGAPGVVSCVDHFTPGQVSRAHGVIELIHSDILLDDFPEYDKFCTQCFQGEDDACHPCTEIPMEDLILTEENITLDDNFIHGQVIVKAGSTLTIESEIVFTENSGITVMPGGKLILEEGALLTKCEEVDFWNGIQIAAVDFSEDISYFGGVVQCKNTSIIEFAKIGIKKINTYKKENGKIKVHINNGHIEVTTNSEIRYCEKGVLINTGSTIEAGTEQESSFVQEAIFTENETAILLSRNYGFTAANSSFVQNLYGLELANAHAEITDNSFENNDAGVYVNALYPNISGVNIERNGFIGGLGVYIESLNNAQTININQNTFLESTIWSHGFSDYLITGNDIIDTYIGIELAATGDNIFNRVVGNSFTNNTHGINVADINDTEFLDNCFIQTEYADIGLGLGTSIDPNQGNNTDEAGNCFSNGSRIQTNDDDSDLSFNYFKFPQPTGPPNLDCKEPSGNGSSNFFVIDSDNEINPECGSNFNIFGEDFNLRYSDCQRFINENYNDKDALLDFIESLEQEIVRIENDIVNGTINQLIGQRIIDKYLECIDRAKKLTLLILLSNNNEVSKQEYYNLLENSEEFKFKIMAYGQLMIEENYHEAFSLLNSLIANHEYQEEFIDVQNIYLTSIIHKDSFEMTEDIGEMLLEYGQKTNPLSGFTRAIYKELSDKRITLEVAVYNSSERPNLRTVKQKNQLKIFPNPVNRDESLIIQVNVKEFNTEIYGLNIFSSKGELVLSKKLMNENSNLKISSLSSGLYLVNLVKNGIVIETNRLIVTN